VTLGQKKNVGLPDRSSLASEEPCDLSERLGGPLEVFAPPLLMAFDCQFAAVLHDENILLTDWLVLSWRVVGFIKFILSVLLNDQA